MRFGLVGADSHVGLDYRLSEITGGCFTQPSSMTDIYRSMLESQSVINFFEILSNHGHIFTVCSEYVQSAFRVCSKCVQSVFRVCLEFVHSILIVCSECVQSVFRLCSE